MQSWPHICQRLTYHLITFPPSVNSREHSSTNASNIHIPDHSLYPLHSYLSWIIPSLMSSFLSLSHQCTLWFSATMQIEMDGYTFSPGLSFSRHTAINYQTLAPVLAIDIISLKGVIDSAHVLVRNCLSNDLALPYGYTRLAWLQHNLILRWNVSHIIDQVNAGESRWWQTARNPLL